VNYYSILSSAGPRPLGCQIAYRTEGLSSTCLSLPTISLKTQ
jgi:hypothetical protein